MTKLLIRNILLPNMIEARAELENAVNLSVTEEQMKRLGEFLNNLDLYRGFQRLLANKDRKDRVGTTPFYKWVVSQLDESGDGQLKAIYHRLENGEDIQLKPLSTSSHADYQMLATHKFPQPGWGVEFPKDIDQKTVDLLIDVLYPQIPVEEFEEYTIPSKKEIKVQGLVLSRV